MSYNIEIKEINKNTTITGFKYKNVIINGSIKDLIKIKDANAIGHVRDKDTDEILSEITVAIMIINQNLPDWRKRLDTVIKYCDVDMDKEIQYFGKTTTANEIVEKFRN